MNISGIETKNNIFLAPMAGVCDRAFRDICMDMGAGMCFSEMVSAKAICYGDKKTAGLMAFSDRQRPYIIQLFGSEPDIISRAIDIIENKLDIQADGYDLNMGCPAPKIVSNGEGSALMKDPLLSAELVRAARRATERPVSVKHRSGWDKSSINAVEFAKLMEDAGAAYITVHPRTRDQFYALRADLDVIRRVKEAVSVPVFGSGDLFTPKDVKNMFDVTGCDGVMIARGAQGNPWIFSRSLMLMSGEEPGDMPGLEERIAVMLRHGKHMTDYKEEKSAMREFRKHINWYIKGIRDATKYKNRANSVVDLAGLYSIAEDILKADAEYSSSMEVNCP